MSITLNIDEGLLLKAEELTNIHDHSELIRNLLEEKIARREAQRRLADLGGTMPDLEVPTRKRSLPGRK